MHTRTAKFALAAALGVLLSGPAVSQQDLRARYLPSFERRATLSPIAPLLARGGQLGLTPEQVGALQAIEQEMQRRNRRALDEWRGGRGRYAVVTGRTLGGMTADLSASYREALQRASEVLTPAQRQQARGIRDQIRRGVGARPGAREPSRGGPRPSHKTRSLRSLKHPVSRVTEG